MKEYEKLAKNLVDYACSIKAGEKVLIEEQFVDAEFLAVLVREIRNVGAYPFVVSGRPEVDKEILRNLDEEHAKLMTKYMLPVMQDMDAYISIYGARNKFENSDIDTQRKNIMELYFDKPVHFEERVKNTKWCIMIWPTEAMAQSASMSTEQFRKLYFDVCTLDYSAMNVAMDSLKNLMEKTDKVRIVGGRTDISFSIKGMNAIKCAGNFNIPDGEVYTAPIKNSVNGKIFFNIPTFYHGARFDDVEFTVENGKIIEAKCAGKTEILNEILDTDEGGRYFGEFAFGLNPYVTKPMLDILFDEKMSGSIHLTPGCCYEDADNGNESAVHWDLVLCQSEEYGGGEIYFDDILIRKNGLFVLDELKCLNPNELLKPFAKK